MEKRHETGKNKEEQEDCLSKLLRSSKLQHSHGVTLLAFGGLSSWAEEEEEAVRHQRYRLVSGPEGKREIKLS